LKTAQERALHPADIRKASAGDFLEPGQPGLMFLFK
jgi:hypothetical protein